MQDFCLRRAHKALKMKQKLQPLETEEQYVPGMYRWPHNAYSVEECGSNRERKERGTNRQQGT